MNLYFIATPEKLKKIFKIPKQNSKLGTFLHLCKVLSLKHRYTERDKSRFITPNIKMAYILPLEFYYLDSYAKRTVNM